MPIEDVVEVCRGKNVTPYQRTPAHKFGTAARKIIECYRQEPGRRQCLARVTADETGTSGYKDSRLGPHNGMLNRGCGKGTQIQ